MERGRLRLIDRFPTPDPHRRPAEPGLWSWLTYRYREQATWRELGYALLLAVVLWPLDALALAACAAVPLSLMSTPAVMQLYGNGEEARVVKQWTVTGWPEAFATAAAGLVLLALGCCVLGLLAGAQAELTRLLIGDRRSELGDRVTELTSSRVRLVDAFEAERRRIERDLHDGAQQRIVALTMTLGLARLDAPPGPLADQLAKAHRRGGPGARRTARADPRHPPQGARRLRPGGGRRRRGRPLADTRRPRTWRCPAGTRKPSRRPRTSWSARPWRTSPGTAARAAPR